MPFLFSAGELDRKIGGECAIMFADYHVHSAFSDDSEYPMEQVVHDAISMGMEEICFTDHVDYGVKRDWNDPRGILYRPGGLGEPEKIPLANVDYPRYVSEIAYLREQYKDRICIKMGLEFGMQRHTIAEYEQLFQAWPFDFIILSVHEINNQEFWTQDYQRGHTQREYNIGYYEELLYLVRHYHHYSVLGHLDLITRYDQAGFYPFSETRDIIAEILKTIIADGKGIEVNTSSHRYGLNDMTPSRDILNLYRDLGGSILTIGSDSHKPAHLGAYINSTERELSALGFEYICTFEKMEPSFHKIIS